MKHDLTFHWDPFWKAYLVKPLTEGGKNFLYLWNRKLHIAKTIVSGSNADSLYKMALHSQLSIERIDKA